MSVTITNEQVQIDEEILSKTEIENEKCTIVHCIFREAEEHFVGIRIWPSTFLVQDDGRKCKLIKAFNISMMPEWTYHYSQEARFTLVFEGLSKDCKSFYLQEQIVEEGGFYSEKIERNGLDVYSVSVYTLPF